MGHRLELAIPALGRWRQEHPWGLLANLTYSLGDVPAQQKCERHFVNDNQGCPLASIHMYTQAHRKKQRRVEIM